MPERSEATYYREQLQSGEKSISLGTFLGLSFVAKARFSTLSIIAEHQSLPETSRTLFASLKDTFRGIWRQKYNPSEKLEAYFERLAQFESTSDISSDTQLIERIKKHNQEVEQFFLIVTNLIKAKASEDSITNIISESRVITDADKENLYRAVRVYAQPHFTTQEAQALSLLKTLTAQRVVNPEQKVKDKYPDVDLGLIYSIDSERRRKMDRYIQYGNWMGDFVETVTADHASQNEVKVDTDQLALFHVSLDGKKGFPVALPATSSTKELALSDVFTGFEPLFFGFDIPEEVDVAQFDRTEIFGDTTQSSEALNNFLVNLSENMRQSGREAIYTHVTDPLFLPKIMAEGRLWASRQSFEQTFSRKYQRNRTTGTFLEEIKFDTTDNYKDQFRLRYAHGKEPMFVLDIPEGVNPADKWNNFDYLMGGISVSDPRLVCIWVPTEKYRDNLLKWIVTWDQRHVKAVFGSKQPSEVIVHNVDQLAPSENSLAVVNLA